MIVSKKLLTVTEACAYKIVSYCLFGIVLF